jgi:arginase
MRSFAIIEAPSILGLFPKGVETLPDALLAAGLARKIGARHAGRVDPPAYDTKRDPETMLLNPNGLATYAVSLANAVEAVLETGEFPLVLGGDCSILLGCTLATKRRGRSGLLFIDGHADFYQPEAEPAGEAASMDLALVTGRGPAIVTDIEGQRPLVREEDVVALARRDEADTEEYGSQRIEDSAITTLSLSEIREIGLPAVLEQTMARLTASSLDGFWIHLDADALDDDIMPAVDYRMPGGLAWEELVAILQTAIASGGALGLNLTIFNPKLDQDGSIAERLVETLCNGIASSGE